MIDSKNAFRAGLVVLVGVGIALAFFIAVRKSTLDGSNSAPYFAYLEDASGINAKSLITVAGLQVGEIVDIRLVEVTEGDLRGHEQRRLQEKYRADLQEWWQRRRERLAKAGQDPGDLPEELPEHDEADGVFHQRPTPPPPFNPDRKLQVARVEMRVIQDMKLPVDTWMKKESLGVLGAKALFLELGDEPAYIEPGGRIVNVRSVTQLDAITEQAERMVDSVAHIIDTIDRDLGGIVGDVRGITGELNRFIAGSEDSPPLDELYRVVMDEMSRVAKTIDKAVRTVDAMLQTNDRAVSGLLANMERISKDIADLTAGPGEGGEGGEPGQGGELRETIVQVRRISDDLADITSTLREVVGANEDDVDQSVKEIKSTLAELNRSLGSLAEVTGRVERGEGTVGRLLTDERMADRVEAAVAGASDFVTSLTAMQAHVDLATWYNVNASSAQVRFGLRLQPRPDKYYLLEIVDDGGGVERFTRTFIDREGDGIENRTSIREDDNSLRFSAMFAKKFWDFLVLRAGLIETSGGVGANLVFWDDRIDLRTDVFNFGGPRNRIDADDPLYRDIVAWPRWRTMLHVQPIPHLYLMGGVDDVLNFHAQPANDGFGFDYFFGAGITFQDDDLRAILPFVPSF